MRFSDHSHNRAQRSNITLCIHATNLPSRMTDELRWESPASPKAHSPFKPMMAAEHDFHKHNQSFTSIENNFLVTTVNSTMCSHPQIN